MHPRSDRCCSRARTPSTRPSSSSVLQTSSLIPSIPLEMALMEGDAKPRPPQASAPAAPSISVAAPRFLLGQHEAAHGDKAPRTQTSSRQPRVRQPLETGAGHLLAEPDRAQRSLSGAVGPPRSRSRAAPCRSPLTLELSFLGYAHERVPCGGSLRAHW